MDWKQGLIIAAAVAIEPLIAKGFNSLHEFLARHPESKICRFLLWEWK